MVFCLGAIKISSAQDIKKNAIYIEGFGNGIVGSINYERKINFKENKFQVFRVGGFYFPTRELVISNFILEYGFVYGAGNHHFECGLGLTIFSQTNKNMRYGYSSYDSLSGSYFEEQYTGKKRATTLGGAIRLGYRYEKIDGRFLFRAGFTPIVVISYYDTGIIGSFAPDKKNEYFPKIKSSLPLLPLVGISFGYKF